MPTIKANSNSSKRTAMATGIQSCIILRGINENNTWNPIRGLQYINFCTGQQQIKTILHINVNLDKQVIRRFMYNISIIEDKRRILMPRLLMTQQVPEYVEDVTFSRNLSIYCVINKSCAFHLTHKQHKYINYLQFFKIKILMD